MCSRQQYGHVPDYNPIESCTAIPLPDCMNAFDLANG